MHCAFKHSPFRAFPTLSQGAIFVFEFALFLGSALTAAFSNVIICFNVRLWWNGIHNGLKIRRRKLGGSNPPSRTIVGAKSALFRRIFMPMAKTTSFRCFPIRKHRGAREKRYSFGYAVFLILALMKLLWIFPGLQCPYSRCQFPGCGSCPSDRWQHGQQSSRQTHAR